MDSGVMRARRTGLYLPIFLDPETKKGESKRENELMLESKNTHRHIVNQNPV